MAASSRTPFPRSSTPRASEQAELKPRIRAVLYADTYDEACQLWYKLSDERKRFAACHRAGSDSLRHLQTYFGLYTMHHSVPGLPPETNVVENVIKQLGKKPRLMEGFAKLESADHFGRLLVAATGSNASRALQTETTVGRRWRLQASI